jgi:hypothetical protein
MSETLRVVIDDDEGGATLQSRTPRADRVADLERETGQWRAETARLRQEAHHNRLEAARIQVDAGLRQTTAEAESARAAYQSALDRGEFDRTADAVAKLAEIEVRRREIEREQQALARIPAPPSDPVEAYCAGRTEPTRRWLEQHRDFITDPQKNARLTSAHWAAVAEDLVPDSPEYFEAVERRIGLRDGGRRAVEGKFEIDRSNPNTHARGNSVFLTPGEVRAATDGTLTFNTGPKKGQPIGTVEAGRRKAIMIREGRYNTIG